MSAGTFRHYLQLRTPTVSDDGEGGQAVTWSTDGPYVWAEVRPMTAREQAIAGAVQTIATHHVSLYYDSRIDGTGRLSRVAPTGPELQILGVRDLGGNQRMLTLDCAEVL